MKNFDSEFQNLLSTWNRHQDLRSSHAPISALADSHFALDRVRRSFH